MKKAVILSVTLLLTVFLKAQEGSYSIGFNHLALSVKDVDVAVAFYKKVLNLPEITNRTKKEGIRWLSLGGGNELHLIATIKEPVTINKGVHLGLATANFDVFMQQLDDLGIVYSNWEGAEHTITIRADGIKQVYFKDPDGYWIEVNNMGGRK